MWYLHNSWYFHVISYSSVLCIANLNDKHLSIDDFNEDGEC